MKRFSKILTLILALVAIVTAFTVVALAEDAAVPGYVRPFSKYTFNGYTAGNSWETNQGAGTGGPITVQEAYPGGNKYLYIKGSTTSTSTLNYCYMGGSTNSNRTGYNTIKYPIVAFDFDLMTPNGRWGLYSTSSHNTSNSAGIYFRPYYYNSSDKWVVSNGWFKQISFGALGLPTTAYQWHHVTVIFEQTSETVSVDNGDGTTTDTTTYYLEQTVYVNGQALTNSLASWVSGGKVDINAKGSKDGRLFFGPVYVKSSRYDSSSKVTEQIIDNMQYTYFEAGYDISAIPTLVYNENWEAPFGKLVASVTVGEGEDAVTSYYDDMEEALAFANANPGCTFAPKQNITANYTVDSVFTIDANIYGTDAETGETIITGKYTGVDTYAKTTKGYYMKETAEGSGIYVATKGDFMLTTSAGVGTAYTADQLVAKLRSPGSGSVIKLFSDVEIDPSLRKKSSGDYEDGAISVTTDFTLDLNGHELRRVYYYGSEYVADENGVYPEEATAVASKNGALFDMENKAAVLNITSTAGTNGKIYNVGVKCNTYVKNGEIESREITAFTHNTLIYSITGGAVTDISYTDIYTGKILGAVWGNNYVTFRMNHCNFYQMSTGTENSISSNGEWIFHLHGGSGYDVQVENSFFYLNAPTPDGYVTVTNANGTLKYGTIGMMRITEPAPSTASAKFTNCEIISADNCHSAGVMNRDGNNPIEFENCRFYNNTTRTAADMVASHGTTSNYWKLAESHAYAPAPADGWTTKTLKDKISITYTVPDVSSWTATTDVIQSLDFGFGTKEIVCQFNQLATKEVDVTVGENTVTLIPGISNVYDNKALRIYADTESDMLLNKIYLFKDAEGNVVESILGIYDDKFSFDWENACVLTASEETAFVGGIKADFNLNFLTGFRYNLYIPVDARLSSVAVEGFEKAANTVTLYDSEYYVYYKVIGTAAAAEANVISATFKVDGVAYSQTWNINAISYADMLLNYPSAQYPNEKAALGAMAKFIKEAVALTEGSSADVAAIDALIAKSEVSTELGTYTEGNANCLAPFDGAVNGMQFVVYNGVAAYKFFTEAEDTEISFVVNGENVEFERGSGTDEEGKPVYYVILDAMRVYDIIDPISVTANGVTAKVSMLDYLTAMEGNAGMELAKALYEFGLAADEYKKDIMANN